MRFWIQTLVLILIATGFLAGSFTCARAVSENETVQLLISATLLVPFLLGLVFFFEGENALRQNFSLKALFSFQTLQSLKYSIPILISWIPASIYFSGDGFLINGLQSYFVGNVLHSCLIEELMFRALVFRRLEKNHTLARAAIYSSILFGLMHLNKVFTAASDAQVIFGLIRVVVSMGSGYALCMLYSKNKYSLWAPLMFHFTINGIGFFSASDSVGGLSLSLAGLAVSFIWIFKDSTVSHFHSPSKSFSDEEVMLARSPSNKAKARIENSSHVTYSEEKYFDNRVQELNE